VSAPTGGGRPQDPDRPDLPPFDGEHFDALYRGDADPWRVRGDWYERRKRALALAALPRERYGRVLEIGCSNGVMTVELARRADRLTALDASAVAVGLARREVAAAGLGAADVEVRRGSVPDDLPTGPDAVVDLVVLSEVGYFLRSDALDELVARLPGLLAPGGELLAVHWRRDPETLPVPGDEVHRRLGRLEDDGAEHVVAHVEEPFLLDVWRRPGDDG
jgi:SAM-dependent methyltransferase